jgi:hypothetical protein
VTSKLLWDINKKSRLAKEWILATLRKTLSDRALHSARYIYERNGEDNSAKRFSDEILGKALIFSCLSFCNTMSLSALSMSFVESFVSLDWSVTQLLKDNNLRLGQKLMMAGISIK